MIPLAMFWSLMVNSSTHMHVLFHATTMRLLETEAMLNTIEANKAVLTAIAIAEPFFS